MLVAIDQPRCSSRTTAAAAIASVPPHAAANLLAGAFAPAFFHRVEKSQFTPVVTAPDIGSEVWWQLDLNDSCARSIEQQMGNGVSAESRVT